MHVRGICRNLKQYRTGKKLLTLARMINTDEDALICDLAETYHIYDYRSLPCRTVATFSCGLRDNSRIKMKMASITATTEQLLLAAIADGVNICAWFQTKDAEAGHNRPKSILAGMLRNQGDAEVITFDSPEEFRAEWAKIAGKETDAWRQS